MHQITKSSYHFDPLSDLPVCFIYLGHKGPHIGPHRRGKGVKNYPKLVDKQYCIYNTFCGKREGGIKKSNNFVDLRESPKQIWRAGTKVGRQGEAAQRAKESSDLLLFIIRSLRSRGPSSDDFAKRTSDNMFLR